MHLRSLEQYPWVCILRSKGDGGRQRELAVARVHIGEAMRLLASR
jgi:hypothetical protein